MPRFEIVMKPTALPNSFAKYRGPEHRIVVEDYSKHDAAAEDRGYGKVQQARAESRWK